MKQNCLWGKESVIPLSWFPCFHFLGSCVAFGCRPAYFYIVVTVARAAFNSFFSFSSNTKQCFYYRVIVVIIS